MRAPFRRLPFVAALGCAATLAGCAPAHRAPAPAAPPVNIVLILADDLGWRDPGFAGSTFYETPHLDRLAAQGLRFTQAYAASPVCSPTRASILSGQHPARLRQTDWIPGRSDRPDQPLLQVQDRNELPLSVVTLAEVLRDAGYATAHIGKWHLGGGDHLPQHQGFDLNLAGTAAGFPPSYFWPYASDRYTLHDLAAGGRSGEELTERLGEEAARFIADHRDRPFFLYLPHFAVHTPLQARPDLVEKYRARAAALNIPEGGEFGNESGHRLRLVQSHAVYAAMVETLDAAVGRVLRALEQSGVADRTLVVFLSDNGGLATSEGWPTANLPLRAGKGWLYEGGIRVPLIVRGPGVVAGRSYDGLAVSTDLFPTLLDAAGVGRRAPSPDGLSLLPVLRGGALTRDTLFWHYPHYSNQGGRPGGAVRAGDLKLIEFFESGRVELYDVRRDPGETRDLAAVRPDAAAALRAALHRWRRSVGAQMPAANPDYREASNP